MKNYCECFYYGVGCGPQCKCRNCRNTFEEDDDIEQVMIERQRYGRIDSGSEGEQENKMDIDEYFNEDNYEFQELPKSMEFDHPNLKNAYRYPW